MCSRLLMPIVPRNPFLLVYVCRVLGTHAPYIQYAISFDFNNSLLTFLMRLLHEGLAFLHGLSILISHSDFVQLFDIFMEDTILLLTSY
jgi:hypothetical protein